MENSNRHDYSVSEQNKIYIIGSKGVGKTSLFHLIFSKPFSEDIESSEIGIIKSNYKYGLKEFTIKELTDDDNFTYTNKLKNELEDILIIFVLFSYDDSNSFDKAKNLIQFVKNNLINNKELKIVLLGNKYDLYQNIISNTNLDENEIKKYADSIDNMNLINISCKTNHNIDQIKNLINNIEIEEEKEDDDGNLDEEERKTKVEKAQERSCICF